MKVEDVPRGWGRQKQQLDILVMTEAGSSTSNAILEMLALEIKQVVANRLGVEVSDTVVEFEWGDLV